MIDIESSNLFPRMDFISVYCFLLDPFSNDIVPTCKYINAAFQNFLSEVLNRDYKLASLF